MIWQIWANRHKFGRFGFTDFVFRFDLVYFVRYKMSLRSFGSVHFGW